MKIYQIYIDMIKHIILILLLIEVTPASAQDFELKSIPASFYDDDDERSLSKRIKFPKTENDIRILIKCFADVMTQGKLGMTFCLSPDKKLDKYVDAIIIASNNLVPMRPAIADNQRVEPWILFSVLYEKTGDLESIRVFPHHFLNYDLYGINYSAPQSYNQKHKAFFRYCAKGLLAEFRVSMIIDENGIASEIQLLNEDNYSETCIKTATNSIRDTGYGIQSIYLLIITASLSV